MLGQCQLCMREGLELTRHHLIPRMRHRNRRIQKLYERDEMNHSILWVCRPCHSHIHKIISEKDMALEFNTREKLLAQQQVQDFIHWIQKKPAGFKPR